MADFVGISSVADRTLFTHRGPIVKRPLPLLVGPDLRVASFAEVEIASGNFSQSDVGRLLSVSGSPGGRNDGTFPVDAVLTSRRLRLGGASFSILDEAATVAAVVALANDIRLQYGLHRTRKVLVGGALAGVHGTDDGTNVVTASGAADLASAILLANDLLARYNDHVLDVSGDPSVHVGPDEPDLVELGPASTLSQVIGLLNGLRRRYEAHRQDHFVHQHVDLVDRVTAPAVRATVDVYPGPLTGPFQWTLLDPRYGQPADSPYDVDVTVNGSPVTVDAVFGLIGAVVLSARPAWSDVVLVSYDHISNPPSRFMRLNSPEFVLNQFGNTAVAGLPKHKYRSSSHLLSSLDGPDLSAPFRPFRRGWKYKALERASTASLNDPQTLLLNVPTNKLSYPVLVERASEETVRYDPFTLPQTALDPWTAEGQGTLSLAPGGSALTVVDSSTQTGVDSRPPFFTHALDLDVESVVSAVFRVRMSADPAVFVPDGVFGGVSFGLSEGAKVVVAGLILTEATNLSSAIVMANAVKSQLDGHVVNVGSHFPDDPGDSVDFVDAVSLPSLLVLLNQLRTSYSDHVSKGGGVGLVHLSPDSVNVLSSPAAEDLAGAISLVNELRSRLNAHGSQPGVHFTADLSHQVPLVRQVGLLTSRGFPESAAAWNAFASDWTEYRTYRVSREADGGVGLFVSGDPAPSATASLPELPASSDIDARFDLVQQAFFGTIGRQSKSSSDWQFVRVNVQPVDADLIENNKQLDYDASSVPELASPPWITYGQGGSERVLSPGVLLLDSTASASASDVPELGLVSGAYRGFLRYEPILSVDNALVAEFRMGADYWTSSVSDRAFGFFMSDPDFSVQLAFLQATPVPAVTSGTVADPFVLANGDSLVLQVGDGPPVTVSFVIPPGANTAASVASRINSVLGFPFASAVSGHVRLSSPDVGASASFSVVSGSSLAKLGLSPGVYFGSDSSPEPKMSWFGANLPELDDPRWVRAGGQPADLLNRVLRASDLSASDYVAWTLEDPLVTNRVLGPSTDWKLDFRLSVLSFVPGPTTPSSPPYLDLDFAGSLVSVDEGPSGKNVEVHLAVDPSTGGQFLNLLSYDPSTGSLLVVAQYAFSWNDGGVHTFNVYTAKSVDSVMVLADGVVLAPSAGPPPSYSGLKPGVSGPSMSFGSGGEPVVGSDMRVCQSVVDWYSVAAFGDSKIADPEAPSRRYVGVYAGGPRDVLSSYYLHQVDWAPSHTYRIMRDPSAGLQVYLDGSPTPAISVPYDILTLPPSGSSFLSAAVRGRPFVAFGAFSPSELSRTRWDFIRYSVGKITLTDLLVPPRHVLNQANAVASPDHLRTKVPHRHQGFTVYSGGTPIDEFMSNSGVSAFTVLGEGTPPVPATQNLETRHGLVKVGTPLSGLAAVDVASFPGFATDLVDDVVNVASVQAVLLPASVAVLVVLVNAVRSAYELHRVSPGVHALDDTFDTVSASPATGLLTAIALVNDLKAKVNLHLVRPGVHVPDDGVDTIVAPDATDVSSAAVLADAVLAAYSSHIGYGAYHLVPDVVDPVTASDASDLLSSATLASTLADALADHGLSVSFHELSDTANGKFLRPALPGVGKAGVIGLSVLTTSDSLDPGQLVLFVDGPNAGQPRMVVSKSSAAEYLVAPGFLFNDPGHSRYVRLGRSLVTSAVATSAVGYSAIDVTGAPVPASIGDQIMFLGGPNFGELRTVSAVVGPQIQVSPVLPVSDTASWPMAYVSGPSVPGVDPSYVVALSNLLRLRFGSHRTASGIHRTDDVADVVSTPSAVVLVDAFPLLNDLKARFNLHLAGARFHLVEDLVNVVLAPPAVDPLSLSILAVNSVRDAFLDHVVQQRVHLQDDDSNSLLPLPAVDLASAVVLANALKLRLNRHLSAVVHEVVGPLVQMVHSMDDTVNVVSSPDATDLASLCSLAVDLVGSYNSHRTQPGVHGSTLLVRLEAPTGVLYEGLRFWTSDSGDVLARMSPFSDDDGPTFAGPLLQTRDASYSYAGTRLPEADILYKTVGLANSLKSLFNAHRTRAGVHVSDDTVNVVSSPDATDLASLLALLSEMKEKFTLHLSQAGVHVDEDVRDRIVASDPDVLAMAVSLVTELRMKYGLHRVSDVYHVSPDVVDFVLAPDPQPYGDGWVLVSSLPAAASVTLVTVPESALRVETLSPGTTLTYVMRTGLPDSRSLGLVFTARLRINSFAYSPDVDTGVYLGFLSNAGPGVAAAIGFDALNNIPYVKIQDVNANVAMARIPFDWADGQFHTYRITRDVLTDSLTLSVED